MKLNLDEDHLSDRRYRDRYAYSSLILTGIALGIIIILDAYNIDKHSLYGTLYLCVVLCILLAAYVLFAIAMVHITMHTNVCKALAGLELGVVHCADDLVILMRMNRDMANKIINGEYDNLMRDPLTCKYIG